MNPIRYHTCDIAAWCKYISGEWDFNLIDGVITNTRTGRPLLSTLIDGYPVIITTHQGRQVKIPVHRAIYAVACGIRNIPIDYRLEVDHINHDRRDCRVANLRLISHRENCQNPAPARRLTQADEHAIAAGYATGRCSITMLALEYDCSRSAVRRVLREHGLYSRGDAE